MKLINMTDFVLWQHAESSNQNEFEDNCYNYAKFLKRPLELGMFVPVDEDDEILYPEYVGGKEVTYDSFVQDDMMDRVIQYNEAKENVLFEGFTSKKCDKNITDLYLNGDKFYYYWLDDCLHTFSKESDIKNIEDLIKFKLTLTESAIKQLGL